MLLIARHLVGWIEWIQSSLCLNAFLESHGLGAFDVGVGGKVPRLVKPLIKSELALVFCVRLRALNVIRFQAFGVRNLGWLGARSGFVNFSVLRVDFCTLRPRLVARVLKVTHYVGWLERIGLTAACPIFAIHIRVIK